MVRGKVILQERKKRSWTQKQLAERAGVSRAAVAMLETQKRGVRYNYPKTLIAIARALGVPLDRLYDRTVPYA